MKNLKQVLALGMAFSLSMSAMAGAAFTDSADIKATEAVDMLTALGVITGYEDGSFKPDGTVTRAEAAKMIFAIRNNGSINADSFKTAPTTFTDISGHWAEGYIKYCQTMGIISGKSATIFDPNGSVKGTELAKMMLVTLGYDAEKAGIYGATWATTTLALASENGLLDDVDSDLTAGLPRQYTAQMMYNAIQAPTVRWSTDGNTYTHMGTNNMPNETMGSKYMDLVVYEGELLGSGDFNAGKDKVKIDVKKIDGVDAGDKAGAKTLNYSTDVTGLYSQYVKVLSNEKDNVYGVYAVSDKNKVTTSVLSEVKDIPADGKVRISGVDYKYETGSDPMNVYDIHNDTALTTPIASPDPVQSTLYNSADQITFVSNDGDDKFDVAFVNPMQEFGKVSYVSDKEVIAAGNTYKSDDTILPEGLAVGDYVAEYADLYTGKEKLVKAEKVTGKVTATRGTAGTNFEVKVNDTWYKVAASSNKFTGMVGYGVDTSADDTLTVNDTFNIYMIDGVVYGAVKTQAGSTDTALVQVAGGSLDADGNYQVKLLFADGTSKVVGADASYTTLDDQLVTYTINSNGQYELKKVQDVNGNGVEDAADSFAGGDSVVKDVYSFDADTDRILVNDGTPAGNPLASPVYRVADNAIVYILSDDGTGKDVYKVITGKQLNAFSADFKSDTFGASNLSTAVIDNGVATVVYIKNGTVESPVASGTELYGIITSDVEEGKDYRAFTVWTSNGESMDVKVKGTATYNKDMIIKFEVSEDGYIANVKREGMPGELTVTAGAIKDWTSSYVRFYNNDGLANTLTDYDFDGTKYLYLNTETNNIQGLPTGELVSAKPNASTPANDYYVNAKYILNSDGKVVFIAVDVKGEWKAAGAGTVLE